MSEELKPCPFCGKKVTMKTSTNEHNKPIFSIVHSCKRAVGNDVRVGWTDNLTNLTNHWNKRIGESNE